MWVVIEGLAGSGKTWLQTRLMRREWKLGAAVYANYQIKFNENNDDVHRFYSIDETYNLTKAVIGFDEIQDLVGHWLSMPVSFRNKIAHHRHHKLDVYCSTQDFNNIHIQLRRNVHEIYRCQSLLRYPKKDRVKPIFQLIRVIKKTRQVGSDTDAIKFKKDGRPKYYFLSRFWTREFYNTFADIDYNKFVCALKFEKKEKQKTGVWTLKIVDRDMISQGKARI